PGALAGLVTAIVPDGPALVHRPPVRGTNPGGREQCSPDRRRARGLAVRYDDRVRTRQARGRPRRCRMGLPADRTVRQATAGLPTPVLCGDTMRTGGRAEEPWGSRRLRITSSFWWAAFSCLVPCALATGDEGTRRVMVIYPVSDGQ